MIRRKRMSCLKSMWLFDAIHQKWKSHYKYVTNKSTLSIYFWSPFCPPRYKGAKDKRTNKPDPYLVANQSTKSIKEKVCSSIYTLAQFTKVYKKMDLIFWSFLSTSSKTLLFLSFQMVHIKQRGAALQAFSIFLPTKDPCHPRRFLFTEECITHCTPKREKIRSHNILAFSQNRRRKVICGFLLLFTQKTSVGKIGRASCRERV